MGAILFPVGFAMLVLLGCELAIGNFALLPVGVAAGNASLGKLLRNWAWVYCGDLVGSLLYAALTSRSPIAAHREAAQSANC